MPTEEELQEPATLREVITACKQLSRDLDTHGRRLDRIDRRAGIGLRVGAIGIVVGVIALISTQIALSSAHDAREAVDAVAAFSAAQAADSANARVASCIQFNAQRSEIRGAIKFSLRALAPLTDDQLTPEQRTAINVYNAAVDKNLPYRDCSPSGIEAYFKSPPRDPAVGG